MNAQWIGLTITVIVYIISFAYFFGKMNQKLKSICEENDDLAKTIAAFKFFVNEQIAQYEKTDMESKRRLHDRIDMVEREIGSIGQLREGISVMSNKQSEMNGTLNMLLKIFTDNFVLKQKA